MEKYYTTQEVARMLSVSVETVRSWIAKKELPAVDFGGQTGYRINKTSLKQFLGNRKTI